jgi:hypothetical protein
MSQKPVCVACACYYRMKRLGISYVETMPLSTDAPRGRVSPGQWEPYKLWHADLWECPECKQLIICGSGALPLAEKHENEFNREIARANPIVRVNDC